MTGTKFVAIIPGAIDDLGDEHNLSWGARSMLRWLAETVDRETGDVAPVSINAVTEATRCSWRAVHRALAELEQAGGIEFHLPKGHDGHIAIVKAWHDQIVWKKGSRNRASTGRNRASTGRNRASTVGNRGSTVGNRASAITNRGNADREREEQESSSNSLLGGALNAAPALEGRGGDGAATHAPKEGEVPISRELDDLVQRTLTLLDELMIADGWGEESTRYSDPTDDRLTKLGFWTNEGRQAKFLPPANQDAVRAVCEEVVTKLPGNYLPWIERSHGPEFTASDASLNGAGIAQARAALNREAG